MEEYIYDGEAHALDAKKAYILKKIYPKENEKENEIDIHQEFMDLYRKYAEYLYASDKEKVIKYLMKMFDNYLLFNEQVPETTRIYRPPYDASLLSQFATISLKFNRSEKDTLVNL